MADPKWLGLVQRIQALAQDGLTYAHNPFDLERYHALQSAAAHLMAEYSSQEFEKIDGLFAAQSGYATPKLDCRGVVFRGDNLLLVKELVDGGWTLPGGWVDVGEPLSTAVEREVREESGYLVKARKLLAVDDRANPRHGHPPFIFHTYKAFVLCDLLGGEPATSIETGGAEFFPEDAIPALSIMRVSSEQIQRMFAHHRDPLLPTEFD
jgi:ADP-ribose pyrophosphatase YjhB (NUDIX family)